MKTGELRCAGCWRWAVGIAMSLLACGGAQAAAPALFFSDLESGPKTGWEGSATRGAAVSVWGEGFGSSRGASFVTVNGAELTSDADYAEWGAVGPARSLERITFWLHSGCQDGAGEIRVTVGGVASTPLPFTVNPGRIYFIAVDGGDNANDGLLAVPGGAGHGPWRDLHMFKPTNNPSGEREPYIAYVRGGTYTRDDPDPSFSCLICLKGPSGSPTTPKSLVGYPGETPVLDISLLSRGALWMANYEPYGRNDYYTTAKMRVQGGPNAGTDAFGAWGEHTRIVANHFKDLLADAWTGVVMVDNSRDTHVDGNLFEHNGFDSYKHNIYIKTHAPYVAGDTDCQETHVGWNEFRDAWSNDDHGGVIFVSKASDAGAGRETKNIWLHDNYFHDGNMEFLYLGDSTDLSDIYVYNNVFEHGTCPNTGIFLAWDTRSVFLYNNTFFEMGAPSTAMIAITGNTAATFRNNLWVARPGQAFLDLETYRGGTFDSDYDLFFSPDGSAAVPAGDGITVAHALSGDPLFQNAAGHDFRLLSSSPAVNAGTSVVGSLVSTDFHGIARPEGSALDLGANEFAVACALAAECVSPPACRAAAGATCVAGTCLYPASSPGGACSDGNACTEGDACDGAGSCAPGIDSCGNPDAGTPDAGGAPDAGSRPDAGRADAGGAPDAGTADAGGMPDAGSQPDAGGADAGGGAPAEPAGEGGSSEVSGTAVGCSTSGAEKAPWLVIALAAGALRRRRPAG